MPPKGSHLPPRSYPHYRAALVPNAELMTLRHLLPDGQLVTIHTTVPYRFVVIAHQDLRHKWALLCRRFLRKGYKADYRQKPLDFRASTTEAAYIQEREEDAYLNAYAVPPQGPWVLLRWSSTQERAATKAAHVGAQMAGFWEPINHGQRDSSWPIASMAHMPEPYGAPATLRASSDTYLTQGGRP